MFAARSKTTPPGEPPAMSMAAQPPSQQPGSLLRDKTEPLADDLDDLGRDQHLRSGFHDFLSNYNSRPIEDDTPPQAAGKMTLEQIFNFSNSHWLALYEEHARKN